MLACLASAPALGADQPDCHQTKEAAETLRPCASGRSRRTRRNNYAGIDTARLKNRTPDEIVAWIIMGVLVVRWRHDDSPEANRLGKLVVSCWAGCAFLGGIVARVAKLDLVGTVLIAMRSCSFPAWSILLIVL